MKRTASLQCDEAVLLVVVVFVDVIVRKYEI